MTRLSINLTSILLLNATIDRLVTIAIALLGTIIVLSKETNYSQVTVISLSLPHRFS